MTSPGPPIPVGSSCKPLSAIRRWRCFTAPFIASLRPCRRATAPAAGDGPEAGRAPPPTRVGVGDPGRPFAVAHWLKGPPVESFEAGNVYVLEFWATWCAPCIAHMEHLSELQEKYADRKVTVIGLTDDTLQKTISFLFSTYGPEKKIQNDRTRYTLAADPDRSVYREYMDAAWLRSIPTAFIIGKDERIEWIGHQGYGRRPRGDGRGPLGSQRTPGGAGGRGSRVAGVSPLAAPTSRWWARGPEPGRETARRSRRG